MVGKRVLAKRERPNSCATQKEAHMKLVPVTCLALITATPAFAAPPEIENYCFAESIPVHFSGRGEREHFIANCIADLTPTPPTKRGRYKKPRY